MDLVEEKVDVPGPELEVVAEEERPAAADVESKVGDEVRDHGRSS